MSTGTRETPEFILYVADQGRARDFSVTVLSAAPVLDVSGMTEFDLGGALLGLVPQADIEELLEGSVGSAGGQRCELYLRLADADAAFARAEAAGARPLSPITLRTWGEEVGYLLDLDGHVLALARAT